MRERSVLLNPSILASNFTEIKNTLDLIASLDLDYVHLDVMDGVFVPNISFGFPVLKHIARLAKKPLDVHLMIVQPEKFLREVQEVGTLIMNVHYEACPHLHRVVQQIRDAGMKPAVTLNPATPVFLLKDILSELDMVLLMSVNPGFGGQKFIAHTTQKVKELRRLIDETGSHALIEVDGGVNLDTGKQLRAAGADALVAGNAVFSNENPEAYIQALKNL